MKILIILIISFLGCAERNKSVLDTSDFNESNPNQSNKVFEIFIKNFPTKFLPIILDERNMLDFMTNKELDSAMITRFVEPNRDLRGEIKLFDIYNYYPVYQFTVNDSIIVIIVLKRGGSGGMDDTFIMLSYENFKMKTSEIIGKMLGDCSFTKKIESTIYEDFTIEQQQHELKLDCISEEILEESIIKKKFQFKDDGSIVEL